MEIQIDEGFVRAVLAEERELARAELATQGVLRALEHSQRRHDARLASAPDASTLDCRAGCAWCCHFSVDVRAVEVFAILDFVERTFTAEEKARVRAEVQTNSAALAGLDEMERMTRNVRCPFLQAGRCTIYPVRPQTCRNYHATDVAGCRQSFDDPEDLDIDPDFAPGVYQAGGAHVEAFSNAMRDAGYDVSAYELNAAFEAALSDPDARTRFDSRLPPFTRLSGEAVPEEFADLIAQ
jgi:Fe-S-cluster containining protein